MWRKNTFTENQDSDQSISEEEYLDGDWAKNCVSLGGPEEKKGGIQVLSQLDLLKDACELGNAAKTTISAQKVKTDLGIEDEVEFPVFNNEDDFIRFPRIYVCNSEEEILPDGGEVSRPSFGRAKKDIASTWFAASREAEALAHLNENAGCSSSFNLSSTVNRSSKGGRGKAKPKFSFQFQSHREDLSRAVNNNDETDSSLNPLINKSKNKNNSVPEHLEVFQEEKLVEPEIHEMPAVVAIGHDHGEHSMAELLDCFQEKNGQLEERFKVHSRPKGRRVQFVDGRSLSPLTEMDMDEDEDDPVEALDGGLSSGDEFEENPENLKLFVLGSERKTMADRFEDALGAAPMDDEGPLFAFPRKSGSGLFGKLQQVMQSEKERDMCFLKRQQREACSNDEASSIDVRILSRCLEAKLTVCCCSFSRDKECHQQKDNLPTVDNNGGKTLTIIFSSKTCCDVELEVGNLIRIHSPWYERN
ncbi:unnamed protein product [Ilex paraguariensis]|uniref:Uncharacterized protein n=1 Tax=Ilex paraguariensis TaxID=185542 RepID=A0ABC8U941_9AQUA